jgi:hypothetical protein
MKILIATQAQINFINDNDETYEPIIVGANICKFQYANYLSDNMGNNISDKNYKYCELTALYWAWKNLLTDEYIGLSHYRRYFLFNYKSIFSLDRLPIRNVTNRVLSLISPQKKDIKEILNNFDVILPYQKKLFLSVREDYYRDKVCYPKDFDIMEQVVLEKYPEYKNSVLEVFNGNKIHHFNMFVLRRDKFDDYMKWLFNILFECENRIETTNYSQTESRVFGFLAERLFTLYIHHNKFTKYELTVGYLRPDHRLFKYIKLKNFKIIESFYFLLYFLDKYFNIKTTK